MKTILSGALQNAKYYAKRVDKNGMEYWLSQAKDATRHQKTTIKRLFKQTLDKAVTMRHKAVA